MHFDLYVEEPSATDAFQTLVPRIIGSKHTFHVNTFRSKGDLLAKIPGRLRGYSKWLPPDWRVVILVDRDADDCIALKRRIARAARGANIQNRVLVRVAVEELEAWWFGDIAAMRSVYPRLPRTLENKARYRDPDAVPGGTWEALDRELRNAGYGQGLNKRYLAKQIAPRLDVDANRSRSFQVFRDGMRRMATG